MNYPIENYDSDFDDPMGQWATSVERLWSNTQVSDEEFFLIAEALGGLEKQYRQNLICGLCQSPAN